jgi:hypothetical protein
MTSPQGIEYIKCKCGGETFHVRKEFCGDNITEPVTIDIVAYCTVCKRKLCATGSR